MCKASFFILLNYFKLVILKLGGCKMNIKDIYAREILDSRGNPTVEVEMVLANNIRAERNRANIIIS